MAAFTMMDGSQARARRDWWENQSKKIPMGPGIRPRFESFLKALGTYNKDPSPESADQAVDSLQGLRAHVNKMPLVVVHPKKYEYFFLALDNTLEELNKYIGHEKAASELRRDLKGTAAGKGVDSKKAGDEFGW